MYKKFIYYVKENTIPPAYKDLLVNCIGEEVGLYSDKHTTNKETFCYKNCQDANTIAGNV